ncbi:MAG: phenylalanine--tRNA ligase subunit beta [Alphaproteobacteria bacterium]|nr:phenylalanine--tRNA ligase subunit beta [Alphaproteobacteria bacterium]
MKFSKKILETFVKLPKNWQDLMEDVGLEIKSLDGDIMNLELLANRGDHYCYMGLAREIHGRAAAKMIEFPSIALESAPAKIFSIDTDKCIAFSFTPYEISHLKPNNKYDYMLEASGVNVIHPAIDITNVVMLELGQPAHIYDADKIKGRVHIRETKKGEKAALLFHEGMTELPAGTCVIADEEKILCVGGVIGCHAAEVDKDTKNILFETALFDPVAIRKTAKALGLSTIASQRFERGGDIAAVCAGASRAARLYADIGAKRSGDFQFARTATIEKQYIELSGDYARSELEINISDEEIKERLARYGFNLLPPTSYLIPTWRVWDIKGEPADLIEELCRSIGYNALPSKLPPVEIGAAPTAAEVRKAEIDSYLVHNGFYEVFTDNLYSPKHAALSPVKEHIALENSIEGGYAFMKNNPIVQAVELIEKNLRVKNREIRAYEWGKIFKGEYEIEILWGVMNGVGASVLDAKGLIQNLASDLGLDVKLEYGDFADSRKVSEWELLHPKRRGRLSCNGRGICVFGEVHPNLLAEFDIKNDTPVFFSFDTKALLNAPARKIKYESPSAIIPSQRDIAVAVPYGRNAGDVAEFIKKKYPQVAIVEITDVYDKPKESMRNITFTLTFAGEHSADDLNKLILEIMESYKG